MLAAGIDIACNGTQHAAFCGIPFPSHFPSCPLQTAFPLDESLSGQLQIDFFTGQPTALWGPITSSAERTACSALNRERARGILEAFKLSPSSESLSTDVWTATFTRRAREWSLPLISLTKLGFVREEEGLVCPPSLFALKPGAEAEPYWHRGSGMVYKLFNLREGGALGKKISFEAGVDGEYEIRHSDAMLVDTLEKIQVLHDMGAHPTEIIGLSDMGDFFIVKQPYASTQIYNSEERPRGEIYQLYEKDRAQAIAAICGEVCNGPGLRESVVVSWLNGQAWLVADLHNRNIMRDQNQAPTIIDALIGPVTPAAYLKLQWLQAQVADAKAWRSSGKRTVRKKWHEDYDEADI